MAETRADFAKSSGAVGTDYDPNWVYHGCLIGTTEAAAKLLFAVVDGRLFPSPLVEKMLEPLVLGGSLDGRPWETAGYGLGVMAGAFQGVGRVVGHTGGGPVSACAVYHIPEAPRPVTIAAFSATPDPAACENVVTERARAWLAG